MSTIEFATFSSVIVGVGIGSFVVVLIGVLSMKLYMIAITARIPMIFRSFFIFAISNIMMLHLVNHIIQESDEKEFSYMHMFRLQNCFELRFKLPCNIIFLLYIQVYNER